MIKKMLLLMMLLVLISCKHQNIDSNLNTRNMLKIKIDSLQERPFYQIKLKTSGVGFDIRINDFPILQFNDESGGTEIELPINNAILSSGKQSLSVKVFPLQREQMITNSCRFEIEVNKKNDAWVYDGKREIIIDRIKMKIPKEGLPFWSYNVDFEAKVPYSFIGWTKSQDLSKIDNLQELLKTALAKISRVIENKENEKFSILVAKTSEVDVMLYEKQPDIQEGFQSEQEIVLPFSNCNIALYGYNKLVRYETSELESCLKTEVSLATGEKEIYTYPIFFHLPEGSNELEIIR